MKSKHVQLLEILEGAGIGQSVGVSEFLVTNFDPADSNLVENIGENQDPAYNFITTLEDGGYITVDWNWDDDLFTMITICISR